MLARISSSTRTRQDLVPTVLKVAMAVSVKRPVATASERAEETRGKVVSVLAQEPTQWMTHTAGHSTSRQATSWLEQLDHP